MSIVKRLGGSRAAKIGKDSETAKFVFVFYAKTSLRVFFPAFHPFSTRLLPPIYQGRRSVPLSALQSKVRRLCRSNGSPLHAAPCRSFDGCRNNTVFRFMRHPACRCSGTYRLLSVSFLSGPTASWANGNTSRFAPACIYSGRSQGGKSSPFCLPGRPMFFTRPSRCSLYIIRSLRFYSRQSRLYSYNRCDFILSRCFLAVTGLVLPLQI